MTKYICWDFDGTLCSTNDFIKKTRSVFTDVLVTKSKMSSQIQGMLLKQRYLTELVFLESVSNSIKITPKELLPEYLSSLTQTLSTYTFTDTYNVAEFLSYLNKLDYKYIVYSNAFRVVIEKTLQDIKCDKFLRKYYTIEIQLDEMIFKPRLTSSLKINKESIVLTVGDSELDVQLSHNLGLKKHMYLTKDATKYFTVVSKRDLLIHYIPKDYSLLQRNAQFMKQLFDI